MIRITKDCTTCVHEHSRHICKKYCIDFKDHEFKCDYCINRLYNSDKFCKCENDDGSQNCCGDHFEFNGNDFEII